ncbi:hypothetical protein Ga0100231_023370 [Opitutaceae bacterium TAV4]|nr:hypothetical protein Ga0100231_023370 [Opitutaceae bacterium TAV4]RRK02417.1 hypothetical protein Ga0100230_004535 [Opitutaceae bacterium TAV3]
MFDIAGSNSLSSPNTMGASVGAGTIIFGNKNTGSGSQSGAITATPNVSTDGRMGVDATATSATSKQGSAQAVTSSENAFAGLFSGPSQTASLPSWMPWVAVGGMAIISMFILIFAIVSNGGGKRRGRK